MSFAATLGSMHIGRINLGHTPVSFTFQTLLGVSRITATTPQTLLGKSRITISTSQTLTGKSNITLTAITSQTLTGKSNITLIQISTYTLLGKSWIVVPAPSVNLYTYETFGGTMIRASGPVRAPVDTNPTLGTYGYVTLE